MIRTMNVNDYEGVFGLWSKTVGMGLRSIDDSRMGVEKFLRRNPNTCFVAEDNGTIIGAIICGHDGRRGYIYHTAVQENRRGRGIGRELANRAIAALKAEGITRCGLFVYRDNVPGQEFWLSHGWSTRPDLVYHDLPLRNDNT